MAQNTNHKIIETKTFNDSLYSLLIIDFENDYSLFVEYYEPNVKQSEGSFDLRSYDSLNTFSDTVFLYQSPVDGTTWPIIQKFHSKKRGVWKYYYSNGNLHYLGNYENNLKEGEWKYYSDEGELQITRIYKGGRIISQQIVSNESFIIPE
nr:hypothetical protein [uncultured Fluviicola sp.]